MQEYITHSADYFSIRYWGILTFIRICSVTDSKSYMKIHESLLRKA
jgi:hypothetical protein